MAPPKRLDARVLRDVLGGAGDDRGVFFSLLGFRTGTTSIKAVHMLNDLAQYLCGRLPVHGGDLLCRLIRQHHERSHVEGNSDRMLRADTRLGDVYRRAYPESLGPQLISEIRSATEVVLDADGGIYEPGKQMASSLATNVSLLGREGFRRFHVGPFLSTILDDAGRTRLKALFQSDTDPVSRFLRPIIRDIKFTPVSRDYPGYRVTAFDTTLGTLLSHLLAQPLSKPTLLRYFALAASLGILLKVHGAGRQGGRPALLALASEWKGTRPLRRHAVQSLLRGQDALNVAVARVLAKNAGFAGLVGRTTPHNTPSIAVPGGGSVHDQAVAAVQSMREHQPHKSDGETALYWPERFALALGRKAGAILPRDNRAGWGQYVALSPEHVEVLVLMFADPGGASLSWSALWRAIRDELGIVVGASPYQDAGYLEDAGVMPCEFEALATNAQQLLDQSCRRGVARLLPDSGAEVGGAVA